jgi:hypothetical protein
MYTTLNALTPLLFCLTSEASFQSETESIEHGIVYRERRVLSHAAKHFFQLLREKRSELKKVLE